MKTARIILSCLLALLVMGSCNKEEASDGNPVTTMLGERTCTGEIVEVPNPPSTTSEPTLPGMALGFTCADDTYVLIHMGNWMFADQPLLVDGISYAVGDRVEITGTASFVQVSPTQEYLQLEIRSIRRIDYPEPVTTVLGERTCSGEIAHVPIPWTDPSAPPLPGVTIGLTSEGSTYILSYEGRWFPGDDQLLIDGTAYPVGDRVEITGIAVEVQIPATGREYRELRIGTIRKITAL